MRTNQWRGCEALVRCRICGRLISYPQTWRDYRGRVYLTVPICPCTVEMFEAMAKRLAAAEAVVEAARAVMASAEATASLVGPIEEWHDAKPYLALRKALRALPEAQP